MPSPEQNQTPPSGPMGQYYLLDKIAQGGMAEIYKGLAYDLHGIRRTVVIKKILPHVAAHREFIDMLVTEAKLAVQLNHGNIAQVYDLGKVGDDYFMVMEYVDGKSVSQIMRKAAQGGSAMPIPIAVHIAAEAASALGYMHSRLDANSKPLNIIHRDISPQNLMMTTGGNVKIIDFGIAKAATTIEITDVGVVKGKFAYMSPEQASGDPLDYRTDIFSLGVVLFEMLTGRRLFKGKDNQETLRNVRRANVPRPSLYRPEIPAELDEIILKSLQKSRIDRYQTAGELRDDLLKFLHMTHPSFQNVDIATYTQHLFQGDEPAGRGEDSQTPLLIIDRTQSAILTPEEMGISEAEPPPELLDISESASEKGSDGEEHSEWTPLLLPDHHKRQKYLLWAIVAVIAVICAVGVGVWRTHMITTTLTVVHAPAEALPGSTLPAPTPPSAVTVPAIPPPPPPPPKPVEPFGDIDVASTPIGAMIYLDDHPTGKLTPTTLPHLEAGTSHTVGLLLKGYQFWSVPVTVHAGGLERVNATLNVDYASLQIVTVPAGATVTINGTDVGKTPYYRDKVNPDEILEVVISKEGYLDWKTEVRADAGHLTSLHTQLDQNPKTANPRPSYTEPSTPAPTVLPAVK